MPMALIFYAAVDDLTDLSRRLFEVPGIELFEEYSPPDQSNLFFKTPDEIARYLSKGAGSFAAWPSGVGGALTRKHIVFSGEHQDNSGGTGRTVLESPAIIRLAAITDVEGCLNPSSISCWTEKGARQRSMYGEEAIAGVDWSKLKSIVASVERWIKKSSPARLHSHPVMPAAYSELNEGKALLWNFGEKVGPAALESLPPHGR